MYLFLAFLLVPLIEIGLFIQVGGLIGLWPTLGIVILTAVIGTSLVRSQGRLAMGELRRSFSDLDDPTEPLAHGAMILVSGVLLLTPGFFHGRSWICIVDATDPQSGLCLCPFTGDCHAVSNGNRAPETT